MTGAVDANSVILDDTIYPLDCTITTLQCCMYLASAHNSRKLRVLCLIAFLYLWKLVDFVKNNVVYSLLRVKQNYYFKNNCSLRFWSFTGKDDKNDFWI